MAGTTVDEKAGSARGASRAALWLIVPIALVGSVALWHFGIGSGTSESSPRETPERTDGDSLASDGSRRSHARPRTAEGAGTTADVDPAENRADPGDAKTPGEPSGTGTTELSEKLPVIYRSYLLAKKGLWGEAVRLLDDALKEQPPGTQRNRMATLRVHLLMENAPPAEGALALASLLSDASAAMAKGRYGRADERTDPVNGPEDRTLFVGPFVVAAPASGWVAGGSEFARAMLGHAQDIKGRDAPHLKTDAAYLAYLAPYVESAAASLPKDDANRSVLDATRAFIALNERIGREGGNRVFGRTTAVLGEDIVSFLRTHGQSTDARVSNYVRFLFQAYPNWANVSVLALPRKEG